MVSNMKIVITYGTYDLIHRGHIRLLERAKSLGDYLIVGVTSDTFDKERGKINVSQTLLERIENVKSTGLADKIIIEEYEGQKIDDIIKYNVNIFTVGSDWIGKFDYLKKYCEVVYLDRTSGISSTEIRTNSNHLRIGIIGNHNLSLKFINECKYVNGVIVSGIYLDNNNQNKNLYPKELLVSSINKLLSISDAIYIVSLPKKHYAHIKKVLKANKHVLCESPLTIRKKQFDELIMIAKSKNLILMESLKTAYSIAYQRLLLLVKSGNIGQIVSIDSTCTSLKDYPIKSSNTSWGSFDEWGPTALLPIFQLLDVNYNYIDISSRVIFNDFDLFTKISFKYDFAVASIKVANSVKSEGNLIISGTKGYAYVPAPWWKTEYFELRYEDSNNNKKYYFKNDGEGIRYEIISFLDLIKNRTEYYYISRNISSKFVELKELITNGCYSKI